jgi:hypothetical protein
MGAELYKYFVPPGLNPDPEAPITSQIDSATAAELRTSRVAAIDL